MLSVRRAARGRGWVAGFQGVLRLEASESRPPWAGHAERRELQ